MTLLMLSSRRSVRGWQQLLWTAAFVARPLAATPSIHPSSIPARWAASSAANDQQSQPASNMFDYSSTTKLPTELYEPQQVADNEAAAAQAKGMTLSELMQVAGAATYRVLRSEYPTARSLLCVAGKGNNGGDAYVVAKLAKEDGFDVTMAQIGDPDKLKGDALDAYQAYKEADGEIVSIDEEFKVARHFDVVVEGLFGVGLSRDIKPGPFTAAIDAMNKCSQPVISVDVPSGLLAATGTVAGTSVRATHTVTYIALKRGLLTGKAAAHVGTLHYASLGVQKEFNQIATHTAERVSHDRLAPALLPLRDPTSHKGSFGKVRWLLTSQCSVVREHSRVSRSVWFVVRLVSLAFQPYACENMPARH
eukprot:TRINITY_DN9903_c0_g1_i3.p1 TRINITY_DN9903_c0_g1~~TRINITY_DN9903_c0_g1_i3.p1  ORF type:complete len:364 (+),score=69.60 TRINITY_DN9903_c0_g1_i3:69-1160(+)